MEKSNAKAVAATDEKKPNQDPEMDYFSALDFSKLEIKIEDMFKSGVHFGHHKSRKNPKMGEYIFATKGSINILNLEKTKEKLEEAMEFISKLVSEGQEVLLVGTRKQAKGIVEAAAKASGMPYVSERWLGGTLTNFKAISGRTKYLRDGLEKMKKGEFERYTKFERMKKAEELERLNRRMGGIKDMVKLPGAVFIASLIEDELALKEAKNQGIPVIAFVDTNVNPAVVDYPIPANEDAVSSIKLLMSYIAKAVVDGKSKKVVKSEEIKNNKK